MWVLELYGGLYRVLRGLIVGKLVPQDLGGNPRILVGRDGNGELEEKSDLPGECVLRARRTLAEPSATTMGRLEMAAALEETSEPAILVEMEGDGKVDGGGVRVALLCWTPKVPNPSLIGLARACLFRATRFFQIASRRRRRHRVSSAHQLQGAH